MTETLRRLKKYFDEDTLKYAVETDGMDDTQLLDWLCRAAEGANNEADWSWAAEQLERLAEPDVIPEPALVERDGSWTEEAERLASPGELPAGPDGEDAPEIEPQEAKEVVEMDASLKALWRAMTGQNDDQERGGIPRPQDKETEMAKATTRTSSVFRVQGLNQKAPTHVSSAFASGIYRDLVKAKRGYDGAIVAGLQKVRVVRLAA